MNCTSFKEKYEKDFKETFEYVSGIDYTGIHYILDSITCDPKMNSKPKNEVFSISLILQQVLINIW